MSKKWVVALCLITLMVSSLLTGCGKSDQKNANSNEKIIIKAAHVTNTDFTYHIGLQAFAKSLSEKTNGQVEVQIFPNGQLGNDERQLVESLQLGNVTATVVNSSVVSNFSPKADVYNLPFIFRDLQHLYKVSDGEPGQIIAKDLESKGLKVLSWWNGAPRHVFNSKKSITTLDDLKGMKFRVMQSPVSIATFNSLGALATPMSGTEVYSGLQQGVIDGAENNLLFINSSKFYEVANNISLTGHFMEGCPLLMDLNFFNSQSPEIQKAILEAAVDGREAMRRYMEKQMEESRKALISKGVNINEVGNIEAFREAVKPVYKQMENKIGKDLIEKVQNTK
ncbi:MAG: tripartite ATP-independent periplasmic transporter solute receptor, DctP family [Sporomusa sp.]|nr:tripartite ATP-independent periplasmic transporter solute receptor, DctP family [Sporomusa sp.]